MASIKKRTWTRSDGTKGSGWEVRYRDPDGRNRGRSFDRQDDAKRFAAGVETEINRGDYARTWQESQVHRKSTVATVASDMKNHVLPVFGGRPLGQVRPSEIQSWVKGLSTRLAPATVGRVYSYVVSIYVAAVADGLVRQSPCTKNVKLPTVSRAPIVPLDPDVVLRLIGELPEHWQAMGTLAATTGLREGELLGLTLDRVDMLRRQVHVVEQMVTVPGHGRFLAPPKTRAGLRTVPLPKMAVDALAAHLVRHPAVAVPCQRETPTGALADVKVPLIFTNVNGVPARRQNIIQSWKRATIRAGAPEGTRFHELRHFYASALIAGGESVKVVQARLGHASAEETLGTYSHLWPDSEDRSRQIVDDLFAVKVQDKERAHG
jgi:integrase